LRLFPTGHRLPKTNLFDSAQNRHSAQLKYAFLPMNKEVRGLRFRLVQKVSLRSAEIAS